jgi:hypothetical protein
VDVRERSGPMARSTGDQRNGTDGFVRIADGGDSACHHKSENGHAQPSVDIGAGCHDPTKTFNHREASWRRVVSQCGNCRGPGSYEVPYLPRPLQLSNLNDPIRFAVEAIENLQRLERQMVRFSPRDKNYESNRRALQAAIQELRKPSRRGRIDTARGAVRKALSLRPPSSECSSHPE